MQKCMSGYPQEDNVENQSFNISCQQNSKHHSHPTRRIFLFPIPLVIPGETIVYPAVGESGGETRRRQGKGEKNEWTAKNKCKHMFKSVCCDCMSGKRGWVCHFSFSNICFHLKLLTSQCLCRAFYYYTQKKPTHLSLVVDKRVENYKYRGMSILSVALMRAAYLSGLPFLSAGLSNCDLPQETIICVQN